MTKISKKRISLIGLIVLGVGAGVLMGVQAFRRRKEDKEEDQEVSAPPAQKKKMSRERD